MDEYRDLIHFQSLNLQVKDMIEKIDLLSKIISRLLGSLGLKIFN